MPADGDATQRLLGDIVGQAQAAVVEEAQDSIPDVEAVGGRLRELAVRRELGVEFAQPSLQASTRSWPR